MSTLTLVFGHRRQLIKASPTMLLRAVLDQFITAQKLPGDAASYALMHGRARLDLGSSMRFANVPAGAKLDVVQDSTAHAGKKSRSVVTVAVQVDGEAGQRMVVKTSADTSLWQVLLLAEKASESPVNLTRRSDPTTHVYLQPVCVILNQDVSKLEDLAERSLASLGVSAGSAVIRVSYKSSDVRIDAVKIILDRMDVEAMTGDSIAGVAPVLKQPAAMHAQVSSVPIVEEKSESKPAFSIPIESSNQKPILYKPPSATAIPLSNQLDLPESFYELTPTELQYFMAQQSQRRIQEENRPLIGRAAREQEEFARRAKHLKTLIRVRFPQRWQLQGTFMSNQTIADVYEFVRSSLRNDARPFRLFVAPPHRDLFYDENKGGLRTLHEAELVPASIVHLAWTDTACEPDEASFRPELLAEAVNLQADSENAATEMPFMAGVGGDSSASGSDAAATSSDAVVPNQQRPLVAGSSDEKRKLPKWLRLSK